MSFLKKLFAKDPVPAWASYMSDTDYRSMKRDVESVIRQTGIQANFDWDQGMIQLENHNLGLQNLSQLYRQVPVEARSALIAEWMGITKGPPSTDMSPEEMRKCLRVRVQPEDYLTGAPLETWVYPVCAGLVAMTAIDTPTAVITTASSEMEAKGLTREEAWEIGLANLRNNERYDAESVTLPDGSLLRLYAGDSVFVASHVLRLNEILGDHPAFVFVPTRHQMAVILHDDLKSQDDLGRVAYRAGEMYNAGPGSISPSCFAWKEGQLSLHWEPGQGI